MHDGEHLLSGHTALGKLFASQKLAILFACVFFIAPAQATSTPTNRHCEADLLDLSWMTHDLPIVYRGIRGDLKPSEVVDLFEGRSPLLLAGRARGNLPGYESNFMIATSLVENHLNNPQALALALRSHAHSPSQSPWVSTSRLLGIAGWFASDHAPGSRGWVVILKARADSIDFEKAEAALSLQGTKWDEAEVLVPGGITPEQIQEIWEIVPLYGAGESDQMRVLTRYVRSNFDGSIQQTHYARDSAPTYPIYPRNPASKKL